LLAKILLVCKKEAQIKCDSSSVEVTHEDEADSFMLIQREEDLMNDPQYPFGHTSNDLLFSLEEENSRKQHNYEVVAQSAEEVQDIENAPAVSMGPYLIDSGQTQLLTTISIYAQRGEKREQVRLLYMNAVALRLWKAMGKQPKLIGAQHRPPKTALLAFGVPFSE
jgi:hypothetical protein